MRVRRVTVSWSSAEKFSRQPIVGEGIRKGLRMFCSPRHVEKFALDQEAWKRALGRMSDKKGGGGC